MKSTLRLTLNAFLFTFILLLPSLTPSAEPFFGDNDSDIYEWNQLQSPFKRISSSYFYNRKALTELMNKMSTRRYVDDSYYKDVGKRQYPIHPGLVTFDALRGEQARLNQNRYRDRVRQNAKFFHQNGRR